MTSYRYLGYGVTGSNGVAHLKYDKDGHEISPQGYHGTGAGEVDVIASVDKPITSSSIVSGTYPVTDCVKWDKGILDDPETRDIYEARDANSSFTRTSEGSILKEVNIGTDALLKLTIPSSPIAVEFDYKRVDGATTESFLNVYDNNTYKTYFAVSRVNIPIGDWVKLRLTISEGSATLTNLDDPTQTGTNSFTGSANNVRWYTSSTCTECHFKNVKVYPI